MSAMNRLRDLVLGRGVSPDERAAILSDVEALRRETAALNRETRRLQRVAAIIRRAAQEDERAFGRRHD